MDATGIAAFEKRQEHRSRIYSYEKESSVLPKEFLKKFTANKKAWKFFQTMSKSYQNQCIHWIITAKQDSTKIKRLEELIRDCEAERKIKRLSY